MVYQSFTPGDLTKLDAAKLRGSSNTVRLMFIGDSTFVGQGSGTGTLSTLNSRFNGMASLTLDNLGYHNQSMWADGNVTVNSITLTQYDSRVTFGTGWASDTGGSIGGNWLNLPSANISGSGKFKLMPVNQFDSFEVLFPVSSYGNSSVKVLLDGIVIDTFSQNQAQGFVRKQYSTTRGNHYIEIQGIGSGQVYLNGIIIKDSLNTKGVGIVSGHCGGGVSNTITTAPYQSLAAVSSIAPDFIVYQMTINDCNSNTNLATYRNNLEKFLNHASAFSNGVISVGFPSNSANTDGAVLDNYAHKIKQLACDYGWGFFDLRDEFGASWFRANNLGLANDNNHPNTLGHIKASQYMSNYLQNIGL